MINKIYAIGRQTADPTQTVINNVNCTNFSVASDTKNKDAEGNTVTNFYRVSAWRGLADTCAKYLHKGDRVAIMGDLLLRTYVDTKGQQRAAMQVTLTDVEFINDRARSDQSNRHETTVQPSNTQQQQKHSQVTAENDELPF